MIESEWITTAEAAKLSGYHPVYLRELIWDEKIRGKKFGIVWQVNKQSLLDYLHSAKQSKDKRWGPKE